MEEARFVVRSNVVSQYESCEEDTDCYKGTCDKKKKHVRHVKMVFEMVRETDVERYREMSKMYWFSRILLQKFNHLTLSCTGTMGKSASTTFNVSRTNVWRIVA